MNRYRTKPQEVEATQYTGNRSNVTEFAGDKVSWAPDGTAYLLAGPDRGAQKWAWLPLGSWVVRKPGDHTNYWQVEPREFAAQYKEVKEGSGKSGGKKAAKKGTKKAAPAAPAAQPLPQAEEQEDDGAVRGSPEEQEDDGVLGAESWQEGYL